MMTDYGEFLRNSWLSPQRYRNGMDRYGTVLKWYGGLVVEDGHKNRKEFCFFNRVNFRFATDIFGFCLPDIGSESYCRYTKHSLWRS